MRLRLSAVVVLSAGLSLACATEERFRAHVESWRDRDANDLVRELGPPRAKQPAPGGDVVYVYVTETSAPTMGAGGVLNYREGPTHGCQVSFLVSGKTNRVVRGDYQGNACRSLF